MLLSTGRLFGIGGAGAAGPTPSYWHSLSRGDRTASITVTTDATLGGGTINNLIDGGLGANSTDGCWFNSGQSSRIVKFDFGTAFIVNGFRWFQDIATNHGTWAFEGSNDDSSYITIGSITLGASVSSHPAAAYGFVNTTGYRYYRLRQTSGTTSSAPWLLEMDFRIIEAAGAARDAVETGNRTSIITISTTATPSSGTIISNLIDGAFDVTNVDSFAFSSESTREIKFDLGSAKILTGLQWLQSNVGNHGTWVFEGSNDDSSYTGLGSSFTLGGAWVTAFTFTNSTGYRYYKLRQTAGTTSSSPWLMEVDLRAA